MKDYSWQFPRQLINSGRYPFSMAQLRHLLLCRHKNGLEEVVRKVGKRLVIRVDLFDDWLENHAKENRS